MKYLLASVVMAAALVSGAATDYEKLGAAQVSVDTNAAPIGTEWHAQHLSEVNAATTDEALAAHVESDATAQALLGEVQGGYQTDPLKAIVIGAVTQYVMVNANSSWYEFWLEHHREERRVWARNLLRAAIQSKKAREDPLKTMFYLEQLRWCGFRGQANRIKKMAENSKCPMFAEFAAQVAKELSKR